MGETLGKGATGTVFRAFNVDSGETAAIKVVVNASSVSSCLNEIQLLRNLNHPNIVRYYGYMESCESISIIMEYCEGGSLRAMIENFGNLTENLAIQYIRQILKGLDYLHGQGIVHRDIKASNILTTKDGFAKLGDFGISGRLDKNGANIFEGSTYWMAPEIIELVGANFSSDIWSLGCTAVEIVNGAPPYFDLEPLAALFRIVSDEFVPYPENISSAFKIFLNACFQRDPNLRADTKRLLVHQWVDKSTVKRVEEDIGITNFSMPRHIILSQYRESDVDDFSSDLVIEGELLFRQPTIDDEIPFVEETLDPLYSRSWSGKFLKLRQAGISNLSDKDYTDMLDDLTSRLQLNSAVWLTKFRTGDVDMRLKLVQCLNSTPEIIQTLDLQLLIALRTIFIPGELFSDNFYTILGRIVKVLPFSAFEIFQDAIESAFVDVSGAFIITTALLETLQSSAGDGLNALRKMVAMSNIPISILNILTSRRNVQREFTSKAADLLLSVSKGSKEILFELGKENFVRGSAIFNLGMFDWTDISTDSTKISIFKIIKNLSHVRECSAVFDDCNAIEIFCAEIRKLRGRIELEIGSLIVCILSTVVRMDTTRLNYLVALGVLPEILKLTSAKSQAKQFAIQIVCELASFANIPDNLKKNTVHVLSGLLLEVCWRSPALKAITVLLSKDLSIWKWIDLHPLFSSTRSSQIMDSDFLYYLFRIVAKVKSLAKKFLQLGIIDFLDHGNDNPKKQIDLVRIIRYYLSNHAFDFFWTPAHLLKVKDSISSLKAVESVLVKQAANDCLQLVDQKFFLLN